MELTGYCNKCGAFYTRRFDMALNRLCSGCAYAEAYKDPEDVNTFIWAIRTRARLKGLNV